MHRKENKTQKNWHDLSDCGKKISCDFYFSKKGDNELDFGIFFLFREKVNGKFYLVRKNRLFFVGLLVYNSTHLLKSTMLF